METIITTISKDGRTTVPVTIRRRFGSKKIQWIIDDHDEVSVVAIPDDPIAALYGRGKNVKGGGVAGLLKERRKDKRKEEKKLS